jgi:hypothetical protein
MDETASNALTMSVNDDLDGENVAKGAESVMESLVVDGLVQALDEDVSDTRAEADQNCQGKKKRETKRKETKKKERKKERKKDE